MACRSCQQHARLLAWSYRPLAVSSVTSVSSSASTSSTNTPASFYSSPSISQRQHSSRSPPAQKTAPSRREFSQSAWHRNSNSPKPPPDTRNWSSSAPASPSDGIAPAPSAPPPTSASGSLAKGLGKMGLAGRVAPAYMLSNQLDKLYKVCAAPAAYTISEELQKKDEVLKTEDGEELGTPQGPWLQIFNLSPSFSSWSHVTMLHMYLILARLRCLDRDSSRTAQAQFVDNFFFDCERVMHLNHGMTSSALRQRYLKDIFMQWRGLIAAYDEGVAKGSDRVLAAAVWRNLFKAREDVDFRSLAVVVAWMRATLRDLEGMEVEQILSLAGTDGSGVGGVFRRDPRALFKLVDEPVAELKGVYDKAE